MTTEYTDNFGLALPDFREGPWHDQLEGNFTKIDALLFSALSGANVALWTNGTEYDAGVTVLDDSDASIWLCAVEHISAPEPTTFVEDRAANPTYWTRLLTGFAPRGEWENLTNYFPYDLTYDTSLGIMALCTQKHTSNAAGNITDDEAFWSFLIDMSNADLSTAVAVTYDNTASPTLATTNVQGAIDILENYVVSLNNVNVTQGNQITTLQNADTTHEGRMTNIETKNITQDTKLTDLQSQITALQAQVNAIPLSTFPTGTKMLFIQAAPPTGWTINGSHDNRAIRIVADGSGGANGGSFGFTTIFARSATDGYALTIAEMPSHSHPIDGTKIGASGGPGLGFANPGFASSGASSQPVGGGAAHSHACEMRLAYVNACVGQKT